MKCIIAGSRDIHDYEYLVSCINLVSWSKNITEVVTGAAFGVDKLGARWAKENGIPLKRFPAEWHKYRKSAGPIRNQEMAEYADNLILLWWGDPEKSPGSYDMILKAKAEGLVYKTFNYVRV